MPTLRQSESCQQCVTDKCQRHLIEGLLYVGMGSWQKQLSAAEAPRRTLTLMLKHRYADLIGQKSVFNCYVLIEQLTGYCMRAWAAGRAAGGSGGARAHADAEAEAQEGWRSRAPQVPRRVPGPILLHHILYSTIVLPQ